ncbi:unnamed protein product [Camellia sinensis]
MAMTSNHHPTDLDTGAHDSLASSPRSDHHYRSINDDNITQPRVRFMCSFGGKILPRPHDNQLRYVGGDTRIVAVNRHTTFSSLLNKLSKLAGTTNISIKYQLPNEDLDALITVTADDDVENMMDEYERFIQNNVVHSKASRLRLFLFSNDAVSRTSSISSLLDGSAKREHWFLDALNGGAGPGSGLERGRSEVSSIVSEVPDYLFGLDNSDEMIPRETKSKTRLNLADNVSNSDPGSPAAVTSSPFCSTSSSLAPSCVPSIPGLPPVKTKPDSPVPVFESKEVRVGSFAEPTEPVAMQQPGYGGNPQWHYVSDPHYQGPTLQHIPVYYVPGRENVPVHQVPIGAPYVQQFTTPPGQIPVGFRQMVPGMGQVYGGGVRPVATMDPYEMSGRVAPDGVNYYGVRNAYPGMMVSSGEEVPVSRSEAKVERVSHS